VHGGLDALGDGEETLAFGVDSQAARQFFDDVAARIADGVNRMAEADDDLMIGDAATDIGRSASAGEA
jgi:hypothetical protein